MLIIVKTFWHCEQCDKVFSSKANLKAHETGVHYKIPKTFKCIECGKEFKRKIVYVKHHRTVHKKERKYKCHFCNKDFLHGASLNLHLDFAHNSSKHECEKCELSFDTKYHLKKHTKAQLCVFKKQEPTFDTRG